MAEKNGVVYYNDSKGTNPDAAIKGIQAMNRPTVLIGGGYDKDSSYEEWIRSFDGKVTYLVLVGQTREKIAAAAGAAALTGLLWRIHLRRRLRSVWRQTCRRCGAAVSGLRKLGNVSRIMKCVAEYSKNWYISCKKNDIIE